MAVKGLHGSEKAAILLLSLGEEAKPVWDRLDDEELREISSAMSNLGPVRAEMVEFLIKDFVNRLSGSGAVTGSYEQTHRLLLQFLPAEKVDNLMEELRGPAGRTMWDKLGNVNEQVLANYLKKNALTSGCIFDSRLGKTFRDQSTYDPHLGATLWSHRS